MSTADILWQGWLLSTGKSQSDWKKRYFYFTSKQLSYHDAPNTPAKGFFEYSNTSSICWLSEGVNYCKQQSLFSQGQGPAPTLGTGDVSNIFILFTNSAIILIGCMKEQMASLRSVLKYKFRPCSVIGAGEFYRKKNKFQWTKNFVTILSSREILVFENEKLDAIVFRIPLDGIDCQFLQGTEANYKNILELRYGDKTLILSTGSSPQSQQQCQELYHVAYFASSSCHPAFPPPSSIAWKLPLLTAYLNGYFIKGVFEREAIYQGIPEEIRPWVWEQLSSYLLKENVALGLDDIQKLAAGVPHLPNNWINVIQSITSEEKEQEILILLCKYVRVVQISFLSIFSYSYPVLSHIDSLCSLAYYIIKSLPLHSALLLFQAFFHTFLPVWLQDNFFQQIETSVFIQVCSQLNPDLMDWCSRNHIQWTPILKKWIQSMFTGMSRMSVIRLWSILLFEGYGSLLPIIISILTSNKQMIMNASGSNIQSYLENDFLPVVTNISDIIKNFRILIAPNQPTFQYFDINSIRKTRGQLLDSMIKDIQLVSMSAKKKSNLVETQAKNNSKNQIAIETLVKGIQQQMNDMKEIAKNDPDVRMQYTRLERIIQLLTDCLPSLQHLDQCIKHYTILLQNRNLVVLDIIDTLSTIANNQTCLPDTTQVSAICRDMEESTMNITLMKQRADIIAVLMAAQVCVWKFISVSWEIHEMRLRKVHNEMRWMISKENLSSSNDYMSQTYEKALKMTQVCADDILKYIHTTRDDLFSTYCSRSVPTTRIVYDELQKKWEEKSEEKELSDAFAELTKQTGFLSA